MRWDRYPWDIMGRAREDDRRRVLSRHMEMALGMVMAEVARLVYPKPTGDAQKGDAATPSWSGGWEE